MKLNRINIFKLRNIAIAGAFLFVTTSCLNDLDVKVDDDELFTSEQFYANPASYKQFLAKIYAGLAVTGQKSANGDSDLGAEDDGGPNEGFSQYLRGYWQLQELTTDEAIIAWGESDNPTIKDLNFNTWNADNVFNEAFFARVFFQVGLVNEYLRETTEDKLSSRGVSESLKAEIKTFRAEARFLRALSYYHAIDIYGKMPFATEDQEIGSGVKPVMQSRDFMFNYVINELNAIEGDLPAPRMNEYGRVDKAAVWMLRAKLYLNARVYTGADKSTEALAEVEKVIGSSYKIAQIPYANLFKADNQMNGAQEEIIFPIAFDGIKTRTYGGTTYLVHASCTNEVGLTLGIDFGWQGYRIRQEFMQSVGNTDPRVMKVPGNSDPASISDYMKFDQGTKLIKFSNKTSSGNSGSDANFVDADFPLFRMGDAYLMYAELAVVNGKGSVATALTYVNALRTRAGSPTVLQSALTADFILNERARELYWEGYRRQDLIRFGKYLSGYTWQWKGGSMNGSDLASFKLLFPIPNKYLNLNSNLSQNPGY
ncbi:RagB/SusD family nutrient uptake outer membrane protein [Chryseobacterium nematophagum]|uniref:RagB/SusD family nutrient uptake outer membrane protein n=1 Tax=Chryseobacterium nematophagum TaxID=2305228 RepID=A0A3M7TGK9_9FLAO|nr:RagB/SusD family nutrient uptake outer membrane protein [Chryseobacterium nematophagum]RNA62116.1 RagB/SusD family nutrient uptake outer membrane protein [Chryseobacterium nematophagum]